MVDTVIMDLYKGHMEALEQITLPSWYCCRCQHRWIPRKLDHPKRCPSCTSAYWDIPKQERELKASE